tara:strand:- start:320 stop:862 length:543 start_codon:yes stop_codon:yes gene_type:complete
MHWLLNIFGWSVNIDAIKTIKKSVIIEAPHTSNWDFILGIMAALSTGIKFRFIIKKEWDKPIIGKQLQRLGAIFIDRSKSSGLTQQIITQFKTMNEGHIIFTPEGTRSRIEKWKSGFYTIAHEAQLPISVAYIDYASKRIGIDHILYPSGNIKEDCIKIQEFYQQISPKNPQNFNPDWTI